MSFQKILVANRGEIACRVMRTTRALGYRTVAVFSDADANALHVQMADEAVHIGAAPASASYLNIDRLIEAAKKTGADAVHPGYGFLSERSDFAQACLDAGLVFIGPPPAAILAMGNKALAKQRMLEAGVPCAPGYMGAAQDDATLTIEAGKLGLPLLVKAVAGGGGRGMRLVRHLHELPDAISGARREALSAFGDNRLMLERLIDGGRHIEVQVFADHHGNAVHLGERDCTAQRRRQKVIEEAPSPVVNAALRDALGRDAVAAALAVGYVGAGTVEFIVDAKLQHYFLEMNTRLQVEHPVTECITGLDLVEWQLRVAAGEPLPLQQAHIGFSGHAIEVRLYAEDPYDGFKPQTGRVLHWRPAAANVSALQDGLRIDHGIQEGAEITPFYDAMVAKLIVHGRDRADAVRRLRAALVDNPLIGPRNNARFLRDLLAHPQFAAAQMHTSLLDEWASHQEPTLQRPTPPEAAWALAAALRGGNSQAKPAGVATFDMTLLCDGAKRLQRAPPPNISIDAWDDHQVRYTQDGVHRRGVALNDGDTTHMAIDGHVFSFTETSPFPTVDKSHDPSRALAPVAGVVAQVLVAVGEVVQAGQQLACVEAMKMEMWLHAGAAGTVRAVHIKARDSVAAGAVLIELETTP